MLLPLWVMDQLVQFISQKKQFRIWHKEMSDCMKLHFFYQFEAPLDPNLQINLGKIKFTTLGNHSIAEITAPVCQILGSNTVLHPQRTVDSIFPNSETNLVKLTSPLDSLGSKTFWSISNLVQNAALEFVPQGMQIEAVITIVSTQNSTDLTLLLSPRYPKILGKSFTPTKYDKNFTLGSVPSSTHVKVALPTIFDHLLTPRTDQVALENGKALGIPMLAPSKSQTEHTTNTRLLQHVGSSHHYVQLHGLLQLQPMLTLVLSLML